MFEACQSRVDPTILQRISEAVAVRSFLFLFGIGLALVRLETTAYADPVTLDSGKVEGVRDGALTTYKGIPFAAPPVGALRWREPRPSIAVWRT